MNCILCSELEKNKKIPADVHCYLCSTCTQKALQFTEQDQQEIYDQMIKNSEHKRVKMLKPILAR